MKDPEINVITALLEVFESSEYINLTAEGRERVFAFISHRLGQGRASNAPSIPSLEKIQELLKEHSKKPKKDDVLGVDPFKITCNNPPTTFGGVAMAVDCTAETSCGGNFYL